MVLDSNVISLYLSQRSRRGASSSSRPMSSSARPAASVPAPRPAPPPPAPMQQQSSGGGMLSGIGSTIVQGMAFGTGSAIAHRAVGAAASALTGGSSGGTEVAPATAQAQQQPSGSCAYDQQMFFDCLKATQGDQQACAPMLQALQACQRNETGGTSFY
jgi:coiled-coil-helix-coiled-coil-helix domain-containing protein 10